MTDKHVVLIKDIPGKRYLLSYPCENTSACYPYELHIFRGTYRFELWGAGSYSSGGYVSGALHFFDDSTVFYLYLGGTATTNRSFCGLGGYNGGGTSGVVGGTPACRSYGGNGATDIRLKETLESRILVAAGSGAANAQSIGGFGGGFIGGNGSSNYNSAKIGYGGSQTEGGNGQEKGSFGVGASGTPIYGTDLAGSGGGGWYGGGSGYHNDGSSSGGGGSSFINGNVNCPNITSEIYKFQNSYTLSGNETMPLPTNGGNGSYTGNGFARITCIDPVSTCKQIFSILSIYHILSFSFFFSHE